MAEITINHNSFSTVDGIKLWNDLIAAANEMGRESDWYFDSLEHLAKKAGYLWECYGEDGGESCWTNEGTDEVCDNCGTHRSVGSVRRG